VLFEWTRQSRYTIVLHPFMDAVSLRTRRPTSFGFSIEMAGIRT